MQNLVDNFDHYYMILTTIIGSAALILAGLQKLFGLKPDSKWNQTISILINLLDRIALNPDESNARPSKEKQDEEVSK